MSTPSPAAPPPLSNPGDGVLRVALAQIAPVLLERDATLARVVTAVDEAARAGAQLVAFGEALVPGYPVWLDRADGARFDSPLQKALHARYVDQAIDVEAGGLDAVCAAAARGRIQVVLGFVERPRERGGHTLYCSLAQIAPDGRVLSVHRKLMPTFEERLAWGVGDGAGLVVHPLAGFRVGALNCWENWMPLPRAALYAQAEDLHVAIWPGAVRLTEPITRFLAREGRSFVVSVGSLLRGSDVPADVPGRERIVRAEDELLYDGGSCVAGPEGNWVLEPVAAKEGVLYADLDPARVRAERQNFDPSGHYSRPDVLRLVLDDRRQAVLERRSAPMPPMAR